MNTNLGLIGKKIGSTQIFNANGEVTPVTAIATGPCIVIGKRTPDKDGYSALQVGFGSKPARLVKKPQKAAFEKAGVEAPEVIREFRIPAEELEKYEVGQALTAAELFQEGQFVDISGNSKGRGFTGVMKRWNFKGSKSATHGAHEYKRHGGSIGQNLTPGRVFPGMKMPGHYGAEKITILNLRVAKIVDDVVLVAGGVPGPRNGVVTVRTAVKKAGKISAKAN